MVVGQGSDRAALARADLQQQGAAGAQGGPGCGQQPADGVEAVWTAIQRQPRL